MELRYTNSLEDVLEFNRHYYATSPIFRRQVRQYRIQLGVLAGLLGALMAFGLVAGLMARPVDRFYLALAGVAAVLLLYCVVMLVRAHKVLTKTYMRNLKKSIDGGTPNLGEHVLVIEDGRMVVTGPEATATVGLDEVFRCAVTGRGVYLYFGSGAAVVVANNAFGEAGSKSRFLECFDCRIDTEPAGGPETV